MEESLRMDIAANYGAASWTSITGMRWNGSEGFQLRLFDQDVEHDGKTYRCVIVSRDVYDAEISTTDVDHSEDVYAAAWPLEA